MGCEGAIIHRDLENREGAGPKTFRVFRDFRLGSFYAAVAAHERRGGRKRGDFSMVRIRLARFALPRLGLGGSKSGVSCLPRKSRAVGIIENVRASAARPEAASVAQKEKLAILKK